MRAKDFPIEYDDRMLDLVVRMHAGSESLPGYAGWIADHMGGRVMAFRDRLLPNILVFSSLTRRDVLDFGCGTGSTTVVLAENNGGRPLTALDIDARGLEVARQRFAHHGVADRVALHQIEPVRRVGDLPLASASFDFVLVNGVLEHVVPFSTRAQVILEIWRLLRPTGLLYISETPNPLWPIDRHTTGLPFIPWLPSPWAHRFAVACNRHRPEANLDARGRRGMTFWEVVRPLRRAGHRFQVLNVTRAGNRFLPADSGAGTSFKRRMARAVLERGAGGLLARRGVPTLAFGPFIEHLCLEKPA